MLAVISTPDTSFDYVDIMYPYRVNVPFYMPDINTILCTISGSSRFDGLEDERIKIVIDTLVSLKINHIICSMKTREIINKLYPDLNDIAEFYIIYNQYDDAGERAMNSFEMEGIPSIIRVISPELESELSDKAVWLYKFRPDIVESIFVHRNDPDYLEKYHVFIQILFPIPTSSKQVPFMNNFLVTKNDYDILKFDPQFRKDTRKAIESMFQHWGLGYDEREGHIIISDSARYKKTIGNRADHNQARFTRFIHFLKYAEPEGLFKLIRRFVNNTLSVDNNININTREIWKKSII